MSAPEVGDRVRVIAGQWTGWEGYVSETFEGFVHVDLGPDESGYIYPRSLPVADVRVVPTTPVEAPVGDVRATEAPDDANGPTYGLCTGCGSVEVELVNATGTRDLSAMGEHHAYPTGYGCEMCS